MKNILVIHEGKRDGYQVAQALIERGHNVTLVTSGYQSKLSVLLAKVFSWPRLAKLNDRLVKCGDSNAATLTVSSATLHEIVMRALQSVIGEPLSQEAIDSSISRRAIAIFGSTKFDAVFAYNYNAFDIFYFAESALPKILFQCHPAPKTARQILDRIHLLRSDTQGRSKKVEREEAYSSEYVAKLYGEHFLATHVICASSFTKESLIDSGCDDSKISVIPYGTSFQRGQQTHTRDVKPRKVPLTFLFVGQFVARKGLHNLARAVNDLDFSARFIFVGRGILEFDIFTSIQRQNIEVSVEVDVSQSRLEEIYSESDVFLFPTLIEGFAHVVLEAMRMGCVPIASKYCCAPDIIENGVSGLICDPWDSNSIVEAISLLNADRDRLHQMQLAAATAVGAFTWERFRGSVADLVDSTLEPVGDTLQ